MGVTKRRIGQEEDISNLQGVEYLYPDLTLQRTEEIVDSGNQNIVRENFLPRWDDYRTLNWGEIYKYPEVILSQIQQLLQPVLWGRHFG